MEKLVLTFKALSDETRLKMLVILSRRRICAKGLAKHLGISEAAVSQHLKVLREAGIISGEKEGYYVYYNVQKQALAEIKSFIEQLTSVRAGEDCPLEAYMPRECRAVCKRKNGGRCCHITSEGRKKHEDLSAN